jgi:hypothetical protein
MARRVTERLRRVQALFSRVRHRTDFEAVHRFLANPDVHAELQALRRYNARGGEGPSKRASRRRSRARGRRARTGGARP